MTKYTKRQYNKDIAANEAAIAATEAELTSYADLAESGADFSHLSSAWEAAYDRKHDLELERRDIERRFSRRNWDWQDHSFASLVALNID